MRPQDDPADLDEILRMARVLAEAGYRELSPTANGQRIALARRLLRDGLNEDGLRMLWSYANACGKSPGGLFSYWLQLPSRTMAKVREMRLKSSWASRRVENLKERVAPIIDILSGKLRSG